MSCDLCVTVTPNGKCFLSCGPEACWYKIRQETGKITQASKPVEVYDQNAKDIDMKDNIGALRFKGNNYHLNDIYDNSDVEGMKEYIMERLTEHGKTSGITKRLRWVCGKLINAIASILCLVAYLLLMFTHPVYWLISGKSLLPFAATMLKKHYNLLK